MEIIRIKPLVERFRNGTFTDEEVGPYFLAYVILETVSHALPYTEFTLWDVVGSIATVVITIFGILHLRTQNRGTFGNGFLNKYFALGWVIAVRTILIALPLGVLVIFFTQSVGGEAAVAPMAAIFVIALGVFFYWWLGLAFAKSQPATAQQG